MKQRQPRQDQQQGQQRGGQHPCGIATVGCIGERILRALGLGQRGDQRGNGQRAKRQQAAQTGQ
jgi:hypothetical protein